MESMEKIKIGIFVLFVVIISFSLMFMYIEGWTLLQAIYFSVATISTVGYGDFYPTSELGQLLTILFIVFGVSTGLYTLGAFAESFIGGYFKRYNRRIKMKKRIEMLENHYIVCGYGRIGRVVIDRLRESGLDYVAIDSNSEILEAEFEKDPDFNYIVGDATHDEYLIEAQIDRAKALISTVSTDSDNVYITLSSKRLNPKLYVVSKADEQVAMDKLLIAGADKVVSPYMIGGLRVAELAMKPGILDFVSTFMSIAKYEYDEDLEIRKILIGKNSKIRGKTLTESQIRYNSGVTIIGIKKENDLLVNPGPEIILEYNDQIYAFGTGEQLDVLESMV
ncbi:TrkA family potassium uptake protein [Methanococcus maripaludis]|uniref:Voltage-gated potassium channel n=1 Tax=Methanococcus maripaludis TaxID=39152 RepID=A0A7J9PA95_METMI|nr:potassium channel protein [Methanococcus maripaludis]MBA2860125.1 voltage-gated potassium channel [Methanococcus maripaludis]